ncbi:MAG: hypothetical protein PWP04_1492 [Candidatus Atribacteria bacterium]|nr:hypothetical protein [Candidatus Atribacteria bacterium]
MHEYDVIVIGGGPSGVASAIAASKTGAKTLLIEKYGFLGGTATNVGISSISPFHFEDIQVIRGIGEEIMDFLYELEGSSGFMKSSNEFGTGSYVCLINREIYKVALIKLIDQHSIDLFLHTTFVKAEKNINDSHIDYLVVYGKEGTRKVKASIYIDATGDGDIARSLSLPFSLGRSEDGLAQPMTLMFEVSGVNIEKLRNFIVGNSEEFEWINILEPTKKIPERYNQVHFIAQGFKTAVRIAKEKGFNFGRDTILIHTSLLPNTISFNSTRVVKRNAIKAGDISEAEMIAHKQMYNLYQLLKSGCIDGLENSVLSFSGPQIGIRETVHVQGQYTLTSEDVLSGRLFEDTICKGFFPIDVHSVTGGGGYSSGSTWLKPLKPYSIPLRCLLPVTGPDNLIITGRAISTTHEAAGSIRVSGTMFGIGHASGVAAALASKTQNKSFEEVEVKQVQRILSTQGAIL